MELARIIRPVPKAQLFDGVAAQLLPRVNVVLVDDALWNPADFALVRSLFNMEGLYLALSNHPLLETKVDEKDTVGANGQRPDQRQDERGVRRAPRVQREPKRRHARHGDGFDTGDIFNDPVKY